MASSPVLKKTLDKSSNDKLFMGDRSIVLGLLMVKRYISFWGLWRLPLPFRSGRDDAPADCFFRQSCTLKIVGTPAKNNLLFSTNQIFNLSVSRILRPEAWGMAVALALASINFYISKPHPFSFSHSSTHQDVYFLSKSSHVTSNIELDTRLYLICGLHLDVNELWQFVCHSMSLILFFYCNSPADVRSPFGCAVSIWIVTAKFMHTQSGT